MVCVYMCLCNVCVFVYMYVFHPHVCNSMGQNPGEDLIFIF